MIAWQSTIFLLSGANLIINAAIGIWDVAEALRNENWISWDRRLGCPKAGKMPALNNLGVIWSSFLSGLLRESTKWWIHLPAVLPNQKNTQPKKLQQTTQSCRCARDRDQPPRCWRTVPNGGEGQWKLPWTQLCRWPVRLAQSHPRWHWCCWDG